MTKTVEAIYDGTVLRPDEPLELKANTRVRLVVESLPAPPLEPGSFLNTARALQLDGPPDWSENLEQYLDGAEQPLHE